MTGGGSCCGITVGPLAGKAILLLALAGAVGIADSRLRPIGTLQPAQPAPIDALLARPAQEPAAPGSVAPRDAEPRPPEPAHPSPAPAVPAASPAAPSPAPAAAPKSTPKPDDALFLTLEQTKQLFDRVTSTGDVAFVDARNAPEFAQGRIATAVNLSPDRFFGGLPPELDAIAREFIVVVYCGGGECDASKLVAKRFNEQGYTKVYVFHDGYPAWVAAGYPVEK